MKRLLGLGLAFCLIVCIFPVCAEEGQTLERGLERVFLSNCPEICEGIMSGYDELIEQEIEEDWQHELFLISKGHHLGPATPERRESIAQYWRQISQPEFSIALQCMLLNNNRYAKQYAASNDFTYLLDGPYYYVPKQSTHAWWFNKDYQRVGENNLRIGTAVFITGDDPYADGKKIKEVAVESKMYAYLKNPDRIAIQMAEANAGTYIDCQLVVLNRSEIMLYLKYSDGEYGILLKEIDNNRNKPDLELFKVYPIDEIMENVGLTGQMNSGGTNIPTAAMLDEKPVYTAEAEALQNEGLLQGNENGLDLLKPLTRMEATALLVRALGMEDAARQYTTNDFVDLPDGYWGIPYAMCAYENGITTGVGDSRFAPDNRISATEFSTLVFRASGETDFDWLHAIDLMVERGIITSEQAANMDLFTRGDMAKIIYEAKKNGMIRV